MPNENASDNAHEHVTVNTNGYELTVHPAFSSRCVVSGTGENAAETELYKQQGTHVFKNGATHPKRHTVRLKGGQHNRDIELVVNDPRHQIARIVVELYAEGHEPGWGKQDPTVETMTLDNFSKTCPPDC